MGITGASGVAYGVDFLRRCPGEKFLVASKWGKRVLHEELGLKVEEIRPWVKDIYRDSDLASPFSSGSNHFDSMVIVPCSVSTLAKIANGIADTLITRIAAVALKEKKKTRDRAPRDSAQYCSYRERSSTFARGSDNRADFSDGLHGWGLGFGRGERVCE